MSRLINDLFEISELAHHGPEDIFLSLVTMIGALVMVFTIHPVLSLVVIVVLPLIILIAIKLRGGMMRSFRLSREKTAEINSTVESSVSGIRVSKAYTAEGHESEKFKDANEGLQSARAMQYKAMSNFHTAMSFSMDFLYLLAFVAGGILYCLDWIQIDGLTAYVLYIASLITPIRTFVAIFEQIQQGMTGFERFVQTLAEKPENETETPVEVDKLKGNIVFENVSFRYKKEKDDDLSL